MKYAILIICLLIVSACSHSQKTAWQEPDFNYIVTNVSVAEKGPTYVAYDYNNIGVEEISPVAALYCRDKGGKQAVLQTIELRPNNSRRAMFICQDMINF